MSEDFLAQLRRVNAERLEEWENGEKACGLFHATELGGEVGELLNVMKKLHRHQMGWRGSRSTMEEVAKEIADVLICLDKLAGFLGVDLVAATVAKFNETSIKQGFSHRLVEP